MICGYKIFIVVSLLLHCIFECKAQVCRYFQAMESQKEYVFHNKEYPGYSPKHSVCYWNYDAPVKGNVTLQCSEVNFGNSSTCSDGYLTIYTEPIEYDATFKEVDKVCGSFIKTYQTRLIFIRLISGTKGRFSCVLSSSYNKSCICGIKQHRRIVGGTETQMLEYPWMSAIVKHELDPKDWQWCVASIISKRFALSTANCKHHADESYQLLVGTQNISLRDPKFSRLYEIERFIVHPNFNSENLENNIMLIRTAHDIVFNLYVAPICLPFSFQNSTFFELEVVGYGTDNSTGIKTPVLQKADLMRVQNQECARSYKPKPIRSTELGTFIRTRVCQFDEICTFIRTRVCQFDSGSPVMFIKNANHFIVGLVSHGDDCNNLGVHTRVTSYLKWIVDETGDTFCAS